LSDLFRDLQHTIRRLWCTPFFTFAVIVTLALGIGANTAIFSILHTVLLKPLPFREPERLIGLWQTAPGVNIKDLNASIADYLTYRQHATTFTDVTIWNGRAITVTQFPDPERVNGIQATHRLLPLLGLRPMLGRDFTEKDNENGSPEVVMLSYAYWQRRFGGDPKVIGTRLLADGSAREIIAVLPEDFWFMDQTSDLILPLRFDRSATRLAGYNFMAVARLLPGATLEQANADVGRMIPIELATFPPPNGMSTKMIAEAGLAPNLRPLKDDLLGDTGKSLWVVMATIGIVLVIACANVANLLLVRTEGRSQELAVRAALGASRGRLARELLVESLTLALLGGVAGVGLAVALVKLVLDLTPARLPRLSQIQVDSTSLVFTLAISVLAGLAFGAIPVLKHSGARFVDALRAGGRLASASRERNLARNTLTVVQVALALVLLIGSGLMIRTFQSMRHVQPGFRDSETLQTLRVSIPRSAAPGDKELVQLHHSLSDRLGSVPGVTMVGLMGAIPMTGHSSQDPIFAADREYPPNQIPPLRRFFTVAPGAFGALGTPLAAGRDFTWTDIEQQRRVVLIAENVAREFWGSAQGAIGKRIRSNPTEEWSEIVGVAGDIRHDGVEKPAPAVVYWPLRGLNTMTYLVRGPRAGTESFTGEIRQAVWSVNAGLPITEMRTMREVYERSMARTAFTLTLLGISGIMAFLLAAVGIYAVISYTVAQRTREIGIRMALGAQHGGLQLLFVRNGLIWSGIGACVGLAAAAGLSRLMSTLLYAVSPLDPLTYGVVAAGLLLAAAIASYLPARRITAVDPVDALRAD
jgi:predicted permease